ncbi:mitochondrial aspartate-glutamate transporter agc1 [Ceratobasidium sp. 414]|nr:mitochondrial aspartate-glutamate transporter agc1 [Ceratobasidium sp. 414]
MIPGFSLPRLFPSLHCDEAQSPVTRAAPAVKSAIKSVTTGETEVRRWKRSFEAYAKDLHGQKFLDKDSFINAIAPKEDFSRIHRDQFGILFRVADSSRRGLVSWDDFVVFETMLKRPDADYWIAFQYFDVDSSGTITFDEFKNVFSANLGPDSIPFDFNCDWVKLYLGKRDGEHVLGYHEFTQLMKGLQGERLRQAFKHFDSNQDGFIRPEQFKQIIVELAGHKLSDSVLERLPTLTTLTPGQKISFSEVVAFHNVIQQMDMVERVIRDATAKSKDGRIDQTDFLNHAAKTTRYGLFSPMEASMIFHFASRGTGGHSRLALMDFAQVLDPRWKAPSDVNRERAIAQSKRSFLDGMLHSAYNFGLGGIAGSFGATVVYPIDLVVGQMLYKNSFDCAQKVLRNEGFVGFYRGLGPQLIGVAPEKAIKLTVNDLVRGRATDPETGRIKLMWELIAGGTAGGCQVIFTNPLEIVKIRLQVQGEAAKVEGVAPRGAVHIVRQLGLFGLYRGAVACLLRDIPFSAIYFPAYAHMKKDVFNEGYHGKKLGFSETLLSAAIAGMPAAYLSTPAGTYIPDRAVEARTGQTSYKGITDAFTKIMREEGPKAFFKGGIARVVRSSPQFGFTLVAYEYLHKYLPYPGERGTKELQTVLTSGHDDLSRVRARNALKILLDVHSDFERKPAAAKAV